MFQTSKPRYKRFGIFSHDLVRVEIATPYTVLDKLIYIGATILNLSKLLMYRFWYDVLKVKYDKIKLSFTDSFLFHAETTGVTHNDASRVSHYKKSLFELNLKEVSFPTPVSGVNTCVPSIFIRISYKIYNTKVIECVLYKLQKFIGNLTGMKTAELISSYLQLRRIEKQNNLSINILGWDDGTLPYGKADKRAAGIYPIQLAASPNSEETINLLLLSNDNTTHYVLVMDISALLESNIGRLL